MAEATSISNGFLLYLPTPILPNIVRESTREALIDIHRLISGNAASIVLNLVGGHNRHLALTITVKEYMEQTGYVFVPLLNPGDYPPTMGTAQEQVLGTERF